MLDPKKSLAIDASPIAPYDDGFSTDSEDYTEQDATPHESQATSPSIPASSSARNTVITENQSNIQRQQIQDGTPTNAVNQSLKDKPQSATAATLKTKENTSTRAVGGVKPPRHGHLTPQETAQTVATKTNDKNGEEYCRSCKGYLTPLGERLQMMNTAAAQRPSWHPPPSKQCCCCHITYPFVALTDESRRRACTQPRCYMCNWAVRAAKKSADVSVAGVKRTVDGAVKDAGLCTTETPKLRENGYSTAKENTTITTNSELKSASETNSNCCRSCRGKLPSLAERLKVMNSTAEQLKTLGWRVSPPTRQCMCCFITFPLASLTERSRSVMCAKPICYTCDGARTLASATEEKAPTPSSTRPNPEKTPEIIVLDGGEDDEEGEVVEQEVCKCCGGKLIPPVKRAQMMKGAAQKLGGEKPPQSRQCACCRVTYPSEALTRKSRKMTRAVPICLKCCQAGGSAIYEMLAVSDTFVEAFKVENPEVARLLLKKKENGSLAMTAENQRKRMMKPEPVKNDAPIKQSPKRVAPHPVYKPQVATAGRLFGVPRYQLVPMKARKSMPAPRLIIGRIVNANYAASETGTYAETGAGANQQLSAQGAPGSAPRLTNGSPVNSENGSSLTGAEGKERGEQQNAAQEVSHVLPTSRTARWLHQFELVDGKTVRERRLEAQNEKLEKKKQRTG
ncbi:hypothetical protein PC129_g13968 [Phytophthora cactorum]|uniref:Uncharacterized protein n=2 Tax=Phytophthora cactorum TaxID=29920 RepID=A0A329RI91_9STRA|nr:hypothetical protein PC112_g12688 [Phytophthora cactorum]KAG2890746.1 hypothetical protein PC114_g17301 [Phytophthora cactorum]KAG3215135.1 hypothetical protein PC129_g13968 [Phytophthora cactorum]KAG4233923.1 hypothetical protein PC116_g17896 [Phytophthora cactorum]RAW24314.1 hypothetical protein PC110_g19259 [Phytophthora cactorum]